MGYFQCHFMTTSLDVTYLLCSLSNRYDRWHTKHLRMLKLVKVSSCGHSVSLANQWRVESQWRRARVLALES